MAIPLAASVALLALGCFSQRGHLYDVESGHTLNIEFKWNTHGGRGGSATVRLDGEVCEGRHGTLLREDPSWGQLYQAVYGKDAAEGAASRGARVMENLRRGIATLRGDRGTVIDCEYLVDFDASPEVLNPDPRFREPTGHGACRDNRGRTYELMF